MSYLHQPLGTIIASVLNFDQLCTSIEEKATYNMEASTYAPCDGRSIDNSKLGKLLGTHLNTAPDMRGKFLRGLNLMYNPGQPTDPFEPKVDGDPDGANRKAGNYQGDQFLNHNHGGGNHAHGWQGASTIDTWGGNVVVGGNAIGNKSTPVSGDIISAEGGMETRPRNIAAYFYIKIN